MSINKYLVISYARLLLVNSGAATEETVRLVDEGTMDAIRPLLERRRDELAADAEAQYDSRQASLIRSQSESVDEVVDALDDILK